MNREMGIHFLFGMPRAGITWLSRRLNTHREIAVFGQSRFWGKRFVQPAAATGYNAIELRHIHQNLSGYDWNATVGTARGCLRTLDLVGFRTLVDEVFDQVSPPIVPADLFRAIAVSIASCEGKQLVIEKTPHHILHAERISAAFPHARFIVLRCEPEEFIRIQRAQFDLRYHPIIAALLWRRYALAADEVERRFSDRIVTVCLGELLERPNVPCARIYSLLGVVPEEIEPHAPACRESLGAAFDVPPRQVDLFWMRTLCGDRVAHLDGPMISEMKMRSALMSVASLPVWAVGNLRANLHEVEGSLVSYYSNWLRING